MKKQACEQQEKRVSGPRTWALQLKHRGLEHLRKGQEATGAQQTAQPTSVPWSRGTSPGKDFHVQYRISGKTGGCEEKFLEDVSKLLHYQGVSLKVETFTENSKHLLLLFCPIASCMRNDIENALEGLGGQQKVFLVVMHYVQKDNPGTPVDAKQWVTHPAVVRTVHTRYTLQDGFYACEMNKTAVAHVAAALQNLDFCVQFWISGKTGGCEEKFLKDVSKCLSRQGVSLQVKEFRGTSRNPLLLFCPIASRMCNDIENALEGLGGEQKVFLVVMHYVQKDNPGTPVDAKHRVTHPAVVRTVHTRYTLQDGFYPCQMNEAAVANVAAALQNLELGRRPRLRRPAMKEHDRSFGGLAVDIPTLSGLNISFKPSTVRSLLKDFHIQVRTAATTGGCEEKFLKNVSSRLLYQRISLKVKEFRDNSKNLLLLFCPIASRMGTDIENALEGLSGEQKVLLVVMHYTPKDNPEAFVDARQQVRHPAVVRTVHTRYNLQEGFYPCEMNAAAVADVAAAIKALSEPGGTGQT